VGVSRSNLGSVLVDLGRLDEAEPMLRRALADVRRQFPGSPYAAFPAYHLGRLLLARGEPAEAEPLLEEAVRLHRKTLAPGEPLLAQAESALGEALGDLGRTDEAERLLTHALDVLEASDRVNDLDVAPTRRRLAELHARNGAVTPAKTPREAGGPSL
jgi:tetratricopeptide (TPR) repeat protein